MTIEPPSQVSTHAVQITPTSVIKTYESWDRGEPYREATALAHLYQHSPGLAPQLITVDLDATPPWISMTRLPGQQRDQRWSASETLALYRAFDRLWSVPHTVLPPLPGRPAHSIEYWRQKAAEQGPPQDPNMRAIYDAASDWVFASQAARLDAIDSHPVLGHGDPRAANFLLYGEVVHLIDFEDARLSHRAYELANTIEHLGNRGFGFEQLLDIDDIADRDDILLCRRLVAFFWFLLLYPGGSAASRNPPGTFEDQGQRLSRLLQLR